MSSALPAKRRRVEISGSVKQKICQHKLSYPKCTISGLIIYAQKELNIDIGKSTISDILKHRFISQHFVVGWLGCIFVPI